MKSIALDIAPPPASADRALIGAYGEEVACAYLIERGATVIDRNWRCARGEADIVALDADTLVMVEVKTRRSVSFGHPVEAVTATKVRRLRQLLVLWLEAHEVRHAGVRIDVIGVLAVPGQPVRISHLVGIEP